MNPLTFRVAGDGDRGSAQGFGIFVEHDRALVDDHHVFKQVRDLVDQVGGQHDRARVLGEVLDQAVVEDLPGDRVEPEVRLVEEGDSAREAMPMMTPTAESCPRESFLIRRFSGRAKSSTSRSARSWSQFRKNSAAAMNACCGSEVVRVLLGLADEADPRECLVVFERVASEDQRFAAGGDSPVPVRMDIRVVLPAPLRPSNP